MPYLAKSPSPVIDKSEARQASPVIHHPLTEQIDSTLYSRQLLVLGIPAQLALRSANILIVGVNELSMEVVKNLALAGVGKLSLMERPAVKCSSERSIRGCGTSMTDYAQSINAGIEVLSNSIGKCDRFVDRYMYNLLHKL